MYKFIFNRYCAKVDLSQELIKKYNYKKKCWNIACIEKRNKNNQQNIFESPTINKKRNKKLTFHHQHICFSLSVKKLNYKE